MVRAVSPRIDIRGLTGGLRSYGMTRTVSLPRTGSPANVSAVMVASVSSAPRLSAWVRPRQLFGNA